MGLGEPLELHGTTFLSCSGTFCPTKPVTLDS